MTAAVVRERGGPFELEELELEAPRSDEVLVEVRGVGLCHTDIAVRNQWMSFPLPAVLGHEGAGIVLKVGDDVTDLSPGDSVVLSYGHCGECRFCSTGHPAYCLELARRNTNGTRLDGSLVLRGDRGAVYGHFFGQSSFATHALVQRRNAIKVSGETDLSTLGPLGCGIQTGAGTVLSRLRPPAGSSIAVFGVGAVGLAAVMAAVLAECTTIVAVDVRSDRLTVAEELGATHTVNATTTDVVRAVRAAVPGGVDFTIDTSASPPVMSQAVASLRRLGTCALLGLGPAGTQASLDLTMLLTSGRTVTGVTEGDTVPHAFIPTLVDAMRVGTFPVDRLVTRYALSDINDAVHDLETGRCLKAVLVP